MEGSDTYLGHIMEPIVITSVHSYKKIFPLMKPSVVTVFSHVFPIQLHWRLDAS
jgi:hypothetical protein